MNGFWTKAVRLAVATAVLIVSGSWNQARSALLTVDFVGTVTAVDAGLAGTFSVGQTLVGSYVFESTTAPNGGSNSTFAVYDAFQSLSFSIGGYSASSAAAAEIQVDNNPGGGDHDRYGVISRASQGLTGPAVNGNALNFFGFRLDDSTDTVFSNALILPTNVSHPGGGFDSGTFFVFFGDISSPQVVSGTITSVTTTPEPATLSLFGFGVVGLLGYVGARRKKLGC